MLFGEINWTNISGNWMDFFMSGYTGIFENFTYPLIFLGIIGYVYCITHSAMGAAATICLTFGIYGVTGVFATGSSAEFSILSWLITLISFSALFVTLFVRKR